jgi:hypothetical protein
LATAQIFTCTDASAWDLITHIGTAVVHLQARRKRDRWFFRGSARTHSQPPLATPQLLEFRRAPGLTCEIRMAWNRGAVLASESGHEVIPARNRPVLLLSFRQQPVATEAELQAALEEDTPAHFMALTKVLKTVTIEVRLPRKALQLPRRLLKSRRLRRDRDVAELFLERIWKGLRANETWRFTPGKLPPLAKEILRIQKTVERLKQQGKQDEAAEVEAAGQRLVAQMESWPPAVQQRRRDRQPWGWKVLWVDPQETPIEDIQFLLVLYLVQEQMIECTPAIAKFLARFMPRFKGAVLPEDRTVKGPTRLEGGGMGMMHLLKRFALPEDWRSLRKYIATTLRGLRASAAREAAEEAAQRSGLSSDEAEDLQQRKRQGRPSRNPEPIFALPEADQQGYYSVDDVVRLLRTEASEGDWVPSRDVLYDWIAKEEIAIIQDRRGRKWLNEEEVAQVRLRVHTKDQRKRLSKQGKALGLSPDAIKKAMYRGCKAGKSWEEIGVGMKRSALKREAQQDEAMDVGAQAISREALEELCAYLEARLARAAAPMTEEDRLTEEEQLEIRDQRKTLRERLKGWGRSG